MPSRMTVNSTTISQSPRVQRKRESSLGDFSRSSWRKAPAPASSMNVGAQMWVIHRVRKRMGVVRVRSSGENAIAPAWMKSRV